MPFLQADPADPRALAPPKQLHALEAGLTDATSPPHIVSDSDDNDGDAPSCESCEKHKTIRESAEILRRAISRAFVFLRKDPDQRSPIGKELAEAQALRSMACNVLKAALFQGNTGELVFPHARAALASTTRLRVSVRRARRAIRSDIGKAVGNRLFLDDVSSLALVADGAILPQCL